MEQEFAQVFGKIQEFTMTSKERAYALYKSVQYIVEAGIEGDFVECGTWKGGSALVMAYALLEMGEKNRRIFLYDTLEGMPKPTKEDFRNSNKALYAEREWQSKQKKIIMSGVFHPYLK